MHEKNGSDINVGSVNKLGLRFIDINRSAEGVPTMRAEILIDGKPIKEKLPVDLWYLARGLKEPSRCFVFTCGCGDAGCAGVEDGILVAHQDETVIWEYRLPQSTDGFGSDLQSGYQEWLKASELHRHIFDRQRAIDAIYQALVKAEVGHPENAEYTPYGFERGDIRSLLKEVESLR